MMAMVLLLVTTPIVKRDNALSAERESRAQALPRSSSIEVLSRKSNFAKSNLAPPDTGAIWQTRSIFHRKRQFNKVLGGRGEFAKGVKLARQSRLVTGLNTAMESPTIESSQRHPGDMLCSPFNTQAHFSATA